MGDGLHRISEASCIGIMSRYLRIHEMDWMMVIALREIMQKEELDPAVDKITPKMMAERLEKKEPEDIKECAEMVWMEQLGVGKDLETVDLRLLRATLQPPKVDLNELPPT